MGKNGVLRMWGENRVLWMGVRTELFGWSEHGLLEMRLKSREGETEHPRYGEQREYIR